MTNQWLREQILGSAKTLAEKSRLEKLQSSFAAIERHTLARMSDPELAAWQADFPEASPQAILANYEWQRRLTVMQVKAAQFTAWLGIAGVVVGVFLGWFMSTIAGK